MIKEYHIATSIAEAVSLKKSQADKTAWFAGGTYINHLKFRDNFQSVISLEKLSLDQIEKDQTTVSIGAMVTFQKLMDFPGTPDALKEAAALKRSRIIRNMATIGGDIGSGETHTLLCPVLIALSAQVETAESGTMLLEAYIAQKSQDLITRIMLVSEKPMITKIRTISAQYDSPLVTSVAVGVNKNSGGNIDSIIIAVGSVEKQIRRLNTIEESIKTGQLKDADSIANAVSEQIEPFEDILGSVEYKKYITGIAVSDCVMECLEGENE